MLQRSEKPGHAEDIVNETFLTAYKNFQKFDPRRGKIESWLFGIAKNETARFLRDQGKLRGERSLEDMPQEVEATVPGPELLYEPEAKSNPQTVALRKAMKRLMPYDQELLICRIGNGMSYEDIERYFNYAVKKDTLRVHVNRAEARLRKELVKMPEFAEFVEDSP
jgi:RNA polymerase sigma-70 factor (ECF subfamily)